MLKLIRLELRKINLPKYIVAALIANLCLLGFLILMILTEEVGYNTFPDYFTTFDMVNTFAKGIFVTFEAVLLSRLIIDEYKNRTITLLFTYPIKRSKLMAAKLLVIAIFTILSLLITNAIIDTILYLIDQFYDFIPGQLSLSIYSSTVLNVSINAISFTGMGLIPLFFGMRKKSVPATIVSAIVIVTLVSSNNKGFSLSSIIYIPLTLGLIGILFAYYTLRNIEKVDVQ